MAPTTSLGNLFQCLTTLTVKNFLTSNLNLTSFSLKPLPLVLFLHLQAKQNQPGPCSHSQPRSLPQQPALAPSVAADSPGCQQPHCKADGFFDLERSKRDVSPPCRSHSVPRRLSVSHEARSRMWQLQLPWPADAEPAVPRLPTFPDASMCSNSFPS